MSGFKKILLITTEFPPGPGGIGNHAYNLARYLKLNDNEIKILTVSDFTDKSEEEKFDRKQNFEIVRFNRYDNRIRTYRERVKTILQTVKNEKFTHIIFSGRFSLYASLFLKKYHNGKKFIAIAHGGDINSDNSVERVFIKKALSLMDLIVPVSNYSKSKIPEGNSEKVCVIPNGFDFENIENLKIKEKIFPNGSVNLVSVGTVLPRKGHHNVLSAFPKIILHFPQTKYHIVGRLADLSKVKNYFEDSKLKEHLNIHGSISNDEMYEILNESQIFILLSESQSSGDFEGFCIAVLEANYFGLPSIGSKNSGLEDSINNGVSGIIVDPHNPEEIVNAIITISKKYSEFSTNAKQWAMKHHWSNIVQRYIQAIDNIN